MKPEGLVNQYVLTSHVDITKEFDCTRIFLMQITHLRKAT